MLYEKIYVNVYAEIWNKICFFRVFKKRLIIVISQRVITLHYIITLYVPPNVCENYF